MIDESYRKYVRTATQKRIFDAVIKQGSNTKAASALGQGRRSIDETIRRIKRHAALSGYSPEHGMTHELAPGFGIKRHSANYGGDGKLRQEWVISSPDDQARLEAMQHVIASMKEEIDPCKPVAPPKSFLDPLLANMFLITDYHLGMKAWGEETGASWDLDIAENLLFNWFATALSLAPKAKVAIFAQLGDMLHWDGMDAVTPNAGNILEGDSRTQKVIRVAIRVLRRVIAMLLDSHEHVHLIMAEGNHDPASSIWLRELFDALYEDEPRITVDLSPQPYYCFEHGKTSLFFHHGHKRGPANVDSVFVAKYREVFGRTKHSYGHMGHLHSTKVIESNLMEVEQHRTLASPDSFAARGGWVSGRSAKVITYHSTYGEVGRNMITPEMVSQS